MRKLGNVAAIALLVLWFAPGVVGTSGATTPKTVTVKMLGCLGANPHYKPKTITIHKGDKVKWRNATSSCHHTTTSDKKGWDSGDLGPGGSFTHKFAKTGSFTYHCTFHGPYGMTATIVVKP
jgi:plastocyanin